MKQRISLIWIKINADLFSDQLKLGTASGVIILSQCMYTFVFIYIIYIIYVYIYIYIYIYKCTNNIYLKYISKGFTHKEG